MNNNPLHVIHEHAALWAEQLEDEPSLTHSDIEELKCHFIDLTEDLISKGMNHEEALVVASSRFRENPTLKDEFEEVNLPVMQLRKTVFALAGILVFFLQYFFLILSSRFLVLVLTELTTDPSLLFDSVVFYVICYHLVFLIATILIYLKGEHVVKKLTILKIKPIITFLLSLTIGVFALTDQWFRYLISVKYPAESEISADLSSLFDYGAYSYPLLLLICFIFLFKKFYSSEDSREPKPNFEAELQISSNSKIIEKCSELYSDPINTIPTDSHIVELGEILENQKEVIVVSKMRFNKNSQLNNPPAKRRKGLTNNLLIVLSGVLFYFFLYFLMISSARVLFAVFQYVNRDIVLNVMRTWSFIAMFHLFFIIFTAGLYFKDRNIVIWLNRVKLKLTFTCRLLSATIALAILDRCFNVISKTLIRSERHDLVYKFYDIFTVSEYTFPFVLFTCFLILFYKYYRDNIKII